MACSIGTSSVSGIHTQLVRQMKAKFSKSPARLIEVSLQTSMQQRSATPAHLGNMGLAAIAFPLKLPFSPAHLLHRGACCAALVLGCAAPACEGRASWRQLAPKHSGLELSGCCGQPLLQKYGTTAPHDATSIKKMDGTQRAVYPNMLHDRISPLSLLLEVLTLPSKTP